MVASAQSPLLVPAITEGLWDTAALVGWLKLLGVGDLATPAIPIIAGAVGQAIPKTPGRLMIVTASSGGPLEGQGVIDNPTFQLRIRGALADPIDAERLALLADRLIVFADLPVTFHGVRIYCVDRSGGRPTMLSPAPTEGFRAEYTCTYIVKVAIFGA